MKLPVSLLLVLPLFVAWGFSSCHTSRPREGSYYIYVKTSRNAKLIYRKEYDGLVWRRGVYKLREDSVMNVRGKQALIAVPDSDVAVPVTVRRNGKEGTVYIQPIHDFFIKPDDKKYTFPRKVFVDINDSGRAFYRYRRSTLLVQQNAVPKWSMDFTPPIINGFGYGLKDMAAISIVGSCIALNRNYGRGRSVSFEVGGILPMPKSGPSEITAYTPYKYNKISGWFVSVKEIWTLARCELGCGAYFGGHYSKSYYNTLYSDGDSLGYSRNGYGIGLCASAYFRITSYLAIGGEFQPQLISIDRSVSLGFESAYDFGFKLRVGRRRGAGRDRMHY